MIKIYMVKTDKCCFITDCLATDGYNYKYHQTRLNDIFFDGKKPKETFYPNWLMIDKYPSKIQKYKTQPPINQRYELKNKELVSDKLPEIISYGDSINYDEDIINNLYKYKYDNQDNILVDVDYDIEVLMEVENFETPIKINYKAIKRDSFSDKEFIITNKNLEHQLFDKLIFPEIMLHTRPCSISSQNLYCIVRQYIRDNIDANVAKITSDYDFCFTVKKIIPLIEPETISYQNLFARTKKERNKIHYKTKKFKEITIFEMTHDQKKYDNYTVIDPIYADNEKELKNKIDEFLKSLIEIINKPLEQCSHCNGTGYVDEIKPIKQDELVK